jgi:hypothetical protein
VRHRQLLDLGRIRFSAGECTVAGNGTDGICLALASIHIGLNWPSAGPSSVAISASSADVSDELPRLSCIEPDDTKSPIDSGRWIMLPSLPPMNSSSDHSNRMQLRALSAVCLSSGRLARLEMRTYTACPTPRVPSDSNAPQTQLAPLSSRARHLHLLLERTSPQLRQVTIVRLRLVATFGSLHLSSMA